MGFLKAGAALEDTVDRTQDLEDQYLDLYGKIGRDFLSREDFVFIIETLLETLDPEGRISFTDDAAQARRKGLLYKALRESGVNTASRYPDITDM